MAEVLHLGPAFFNQTLEAVIDATQFDVQTPGPAPVRLNLGTSAIGAKLRAEFLLGNQRVLG